jgi:hypothetical protein
MGFLFGDLNGTIYVDKISLVQEVKKEPTLKSSILYHAKEASLNY